MLRVPSDFQLIDHLVRVGKLSIELADEFNRELCKYNAFDLKWHGLTFLAMNTPSKGSTVFKRSVQPHHDAVLSFAFVKDKWRVGMYAVPGKAPDLSKIAVLYGGGGHKQACGFGSNRQILQNRKLETLMKSLFKYALSFGFGFMTMMLIAHVELMHIESKLRLLDEIYTKDLNEYSRMLKETNKRLEDAKADRDLALTLASSFSKIASEYQKKVEEQNRNNAL